MDKILKSKLVSALTQYDERELKAAQKNPRRNWNSNALGIYLARAEDIERDCDAGAELSQAITAGFSGSLRNFVLKKMGFEKNESENGSWTYKPVKAKEI